MAALYAQAKAGKSLFTLEVAVKLATGQAVLMQPAGPPIHVGYFDLEMTEADLQERLLGMGYDETSDLSHFHYYLMPTLPPLDSWEGGQVLLAIVELHQLDLVIIDTMSRVIQGEENSSDTFFDFYRHTVLPIKALGVTILRLDHSGKNAEQGMRGSSAKSGDVDVVWFMVVDDNSVVTLKATHRRVSWVPEQIVIQRSDDPAISHRLAPGTSTVPAGTNDCIADLDALGVPVGATLNQCQKALREAGKGRRRSVIAAAIRARLTGLDDPKRFPEPPLSTGPVSYSGTGQRKPSFTSSGTGQEPREPANHGDRGNGGVSRSGTPVPHTRPADPPSEFEELF